MSHVAKTFKLDPKVAKELKITAIREDRSQVAIVERALADYFTESKASGSDKRTAETTAQPSA